MLEIVSRAITGNRITALLTEALGADLCAYLEDPETIELLANPDGTVWIDTQSNGRRLTDQRLSARTAQTIISIVSGAAAEETHRYSPLIEAELPGSGYRFSGVLPPIVASPAFSIRKRAGKIYTLAEYVEAGILSRGQSEFLGEAVRDRANIIVSGGTGSGKTTLVNALLHEIAETGDRVVIIEDTIELMCAAADKVALRTKTHVATMKDLLRATLRLRPDRIIVGEVRGGEALDLIKAWNTGTPGGIATLHADSAVRALMRLEQLISEVSTSSQREAIAEAVDYVVQIRRTATGRRIDEIIEVKGLDETRNYITRNLNFEGGP